MEFDLDINHYIQRDIFSKLVFNDVQRFSELKPANVESNLFMYHLDQLIKQGFIEKSQKQYQLAAKGRWFADQVSLKTLRYRVQPKLVAILAISEKSGEQWLMNERIHQPHFGALGFPSGKLHYGESWAEAASRELKEKAGISKVPLTYRGLVSMRFGKGQYMRQVIGAVFAGELAKSSAKKVHSSSGVARWAGPETLDQSKFIPGYWEIRELLQTPGNFFAEFDFDE